MARRICKGLQGGGGRKCRRAQDRKGGKEKSPPLDPRDPYVVSQSSNPPGQEIPIGSRQHKGILQEKAGDFSTTPLTPRLSTLSIEMFLPQKPCIDTIDTCSEINSCQTKTQTRISKDKLKGLFHEAITFLEQKMY
ncbi:hypothetical protein LSTR_LSTR017628 [Laodelphax striatellus]|uniref:Uncharacterized protein n=1 Tax=Laodelphax striatellus TaxID=195883 RepID=A0A482XF61_LAOST|nr:hypothetical protein LSTR_LSTR016725 [Laodelphax striatellus]RZF44344.1 hypothetical protein LSTR_LSTR017628 [Laodelphax striatellus]